MGLKPAFLLFCILCVVQSEEDVAETRRKAVYIPPDAPQDAYLVLPLNQDDIGPKLIVSKAKKDDADDAIAKYDGKWSVEVHESSAVDGDYALVLKSKAKHHAISTKLSRPIQFDTPEVVIQYEVKFADGIDCGGAYIKLLSGSPDLKLTEFTDKTPYTIMFGPDKCGLDNKFHFILRYRNKKTNQYEEKHAKRITSDISGYFSDKRTHLYTLVLRRDNSFERFIDQVSVHRGNLLDDLEPAINPPAEINDPEDKKPSDWDERETIPDPSAVKPDDWDENAPEYIIDESATKPEGWLDDEPEMIPDPSVQQPEDWDTDTDGDWEPPLIKNKLCEEAPGCGKWQKPKISNPSYKGKWTPPMITNPAYKGVWEPRKIPNPSHFYDPEPFTSLDPVAAMGIEVWSMNDNIVFDNFIIVDSLTSAEHFAAQTWAIKKDAERLADPKAHSVVDAIRENWKDRPLVVLGIGLAFSLPLLFCFWYIFRLATKTPPSAMHKKTDAATPDDVDPTKYDDNKPRRPKSPAANPETASRKPTDADGDGEEEQESEEDSIVQDAELVEENGTQDSESTDAAELVEPKKDTVRKRRSRRE